MNQADGFIRAFDPCRCDIIGFPEDVEAKNLRRRLRGGMGRRPPGWAVAIGAISRLPLYVGAEIS